MYRTDPTQNGTGLAGRHGPVCEALQEAPEVRMAVECACGPGVPNMFPPQPIPAFPHRFWVPRAGAALACVALCSLPRAEAHGLSEDSKQAMSEGGILEYIWLGAEHMVTGYDHLLFLFGVIFFLTGFRDVVRFITAFTIGHCITLLGATLAGITANAYLIDAVIALSVVYKGFENLDGFKKYFSIRAPNLLVMVFIFGLIHGFGLSTRLQELPLGDSGLISRILAFNVGVELGQVAALSVMIAFFAAWRSSKTFERFGQVVNTALVLAGAGLFVFQVNGYFHAHEHDAHHALEVEVHGAEDHHDAKEAHGHDEEPKAPDAETHEDAGGHDHAEKAGHDHGEKAEHGHEHAEKAGHSHDDKAGHEHNEEAEHDHDHP